MITTFFQGDAKALQKNRLEMKKHLVKSFGQSKGQKMYEQADRMAVDPEALQSKLNKAALDVDQNKLVTAGEAPSMVLTPPCDRFGFFWFALLVVLFKCRIAFLETPAPCPVCMT
jgi:hypothetical protein